MRSEGQGLCSEQQGCAPHDELERDLVGPRARSLAVTSTMPPSGHLMSILMPCERQARHITAQHARHSNCAVTVMPPYTQDLAGPRPRTAYFGFFAGAGASSGSLACATKSTLAQHAGRPRQVGGAFRLAANRREHPCMQQTAWSAPETSCLRAQRECASNSQPLPSCSRCRCPG